MRSSWRATTSGQAEPSRSDESLKQTLKSALQWAVVCVLDHPVVTADSEVSFAERGLLWHVRTGTAACRPTLLFPATREVGWRHKTNSDQKCAVARRR